MPSPLPRRTLTTLLAVLSTLVLTAFWGCLVVMLVLPIDWVVVVGGSVAALLLLIGPVVHVLAVSFLARWERTQIAPMERLHRVALLSWSVAWSALWVAACSLGTLTSLGLWFMATSVGRPQRLAWRVSLRVPPRVRGVRRPQRFRPLIALRWLHDGMGEHASVPVFEQLADDLQSLDAPPSLVDRARVAAAQELAHTHRCYDVVAHTCGLVLLPGTLPQPQPLRRREGRIERFRRLADEALIDGIIGEGEAARSAADRADRARDSRLREHLMAIAEEEGEHAQLAASVRAWCLQEMR